MDKINIYNLKNSIEYSNKSIVSKKIFYNEKDNLTLFAFDKNESISAHKTPFDAIVIVADGKAKIQIEEETFNLVENDMIIMPANKMHAVYAEEKMKMLLIMIKKD